MYNSKKNKKSTEQRIEKLTKVLEKRRDDFTIVLENIFDPHNLSACLRSCDAVGIMSVHLVYHSGFKFNGKLGIASSAGSKKWVKIERYTSVEETYNALREQGFKIYTTHLSNDSVSLYETDLTQKTAVVFGNEHAGVSEKAVQLADGNLIIPQIGLIQSLNISVACAVTVYEAFRQRIAAGMYNEPYLKGADFDAKLKEWLSK